MATKAENAELSKILATMRSRHALAIDAYSETRQHELNDLKFAAASPDNNWQWPSDVLSTRAAANGQPSRPCLTINKLPQHIKQITNDQRQNRPSAKVVPVDDKSDPETAEIFNGIIRHIESISDADIAYDTGCENQVTFGEGYWRILTDYVDDDSFDQEIRIGRIRNSFAVTMDPMAQDPCGADAKWWIISDDIPHDEYEATWPDAQKISAIRSTAIGDPQFGQWVGQKTIRIAEYFYVDYERYTLNLYPGNAAARDGTVLDARLREQYGNPVRTRPVAKKHVKWIKSNGFEALEQGDWAGAFIPVVRVVGNEFEVEGKIHISGIVRNAKDAQRMYNYWSSQEAEMLALAPKAPFIGYSGQFKGYERKWQTANTIPWPYLEINPQVTDANGAVLPPPQRSQPPMAQVGLIQAKMGAAEDIKGSTGQYDASLGMVSNERSGKAIRERKTAADMGSYHYVDNLARAVRYTARQLVDLIPKIYDTQRIARIIGLDGDVKSVKIDPTQQEPVRKIVDDQGNVIEKIYNPGVGKYDVMVTTGPSYQTRRQEAMESMAQILQGVPDLWKVAGDLFAKNMDWPGAQDFADRLRKTIDPKLLDEDSPELQAAKSQIEQMGKQMEQMHQMLKNAQSSMEQQELNIRKFEASVKAFDAETKRLSAIGSNLQPEQVQDIVQGTIDAMLDAGDLLPGGIPDDDTMAPQSQPMPHAPTPGIGIPQ